MVKFSKIRGRITKISRNKCVRRYKTKILCGGNYILKFDYIDTPYTIVLNDNMYKLENSIVIEECDLDNFHYQSVRCK